MGVRSKQILSLLREHGPLSLKVIAQAIEPPMVVRRCQEVMQSLQEKGLVRKFNSYLPDRTGNFYTLRRTTPELKIVAEALGYEPQDFSVCYVRGAEVKHGEQCALWAEFFKKSYPEALVVRDWELHKHPELKTAFTGEEENRDLLPDVVILFKAEAAYEPLLIAVEIERTLKESRRLVQKVRSLAMDTGLDGVIYVCGDFEIGEAVRDAMKSAEIRKSRRIGAYAADFILFSSLDALAGKLGPRCVNAMLDARKIEDWVDVMRASRVRGRTSVMFELPA